MKLTLHMYVAQPRKGHWEVSIPWVAALAEPARGPSPAQLKEELMFRALELVHGEFGPDQLDRLLPLERPYLTTIYLDVRRRIDEERPEVQMNATTHVVVGTWPGDAVTRLWLPRVPGTCLALQRVDDMYASLNAWAKDWANDNAADNLERLQCSYVGQIESFEVDLGWPSTAAAETPTRGGRLRRPATLQEVATNLSHRAEDDSLGRAFGRDKLVDELVEALMSPRPQNICLVGPPGVGKTALVHEAARRAFGLAAAYQERRDIWQTSGDRIIAGMSIIGQWEQRVELLCRELAQREDVLFVEDLLGVVRAGRTSHGDSNVARFIEPYLEQDRFSVIAEATEQTWVWARADAPGFVDKFRRIQVPELSYGETLGVVSDLVREIEGSYPVRYTADGVETLLHLARRFFRQEAFPGKAVRLVRQCQHDAARLRHDDGEVVRIDPDRVVNVVKRQTGLPATILRPGFGRTLGEVRATFSSRVFGQPRAVEVVSRLVVAIEQGLVDPQRPLAALLLVGPSGVGKTETAKALAHDLFGSDDRMVRFDMSEFSESTALSRLIGTPRQPDGELTSKVRLQPFCVLLFDEVEKAHSMVLDVLLQLLGDGRLTDAAGRTVDFRNAIVVMTSNLGASSEDRWLGFQEQTRGDRELHYRRAAEDFFRPELFNRIDHVVPYSPLGPEALRRIARRTLQNLLERRGLRQAQVMVDVDEGLIDHLVHRSVDPRYGARTLGHRIEQTLVVPLARQLTSWRGGDSLTRVIMAPSDDGVELSLHTIERAPTVVSTVAVSESARDADEILRELADLTQQADRLASAERRDAIVADYNALLGRINALGSSHAEARSLADDLRRHEAVLDRLGRLERRVAGLQDPRATGGFLRASQVDERELKGKAHRWAKIAGELRTEVRWIECQMEALGHDGPSGLTLVVAGLSGPYSPLLVQWARWIEALDRGFALESIWAQRTADGGWAPDAPGPASTAFAVSSLAPGVRDLFGALAGYTWSPRLPSHGQHALALTRSLQGGAHDVANLIERLSQTVTPEQAHYVEFVEANNQLEDVRMGVKYTIPDDRADNLFELLVQVVFHRMTAVTEPEHVSKMTTVTGEVADG